MALLKDSPREKHIDYPLLTILFILIAWGIFTVGTVSFPFSLEKYGHPWYYLFHQVIMLVGGTFLAILLFKIPLRTLKKWAAILFFANLLLTSLVFLPKIGQEIGGARRWLSFEGFFSLQPSEFLKISFVLYLATWLASRLDSPKKKSFSLLLLPFLVILAVLVVILIFQPDMSTLGIISLVGILMYFTGFTPWWHTVLLVTIGAGGALFLIKIAPYRLARVLVLLKPATDPLGIGYQIRQALVAIGSGKLFGIGGGFSLGLSRQKFGFLPQPMTDSIFAIIGEETGFVGCTLLLLFFLFFAWRGLRISQLTKDNFLKFLTLGITSWITFQALFNIGGVIGILPLAGIPLPFFSYGGSHLIAEMAAVGILLNISKKHPDAKL